MTRSVFIRCDGSGCNNQVPEGLAEDNGWQKDDLDSDFCPECLQVAEDLANSEASGDELLTFVGLVDTESDKAIREARDRGVEPPESLGVPLVGPVMSGEQFDEALEAVIKDLTKTLTREKKSKGFIAKTVRLLREQADSLRVKGR